MQSAGKMNGVRIDADLLNDFTAMTMPLAELGAQVRAAIRGEQNYISRFVQPCMIRPYKGAWARLRRLVFARDCYRCRYCGADCSAPGVEAHCDHVVPLARNGSNDPENLVTACRPCNLSKGAQTLEEWRP